LSNISVISEKTLTLDMTDVKAMPDDGSAPRA